jgi:type VI secretion system protein ImpF
MRTPVQSTSVLNCWAVGKNAHVDPMADLGRKTTIVPSMLDRLLDGEPQISREAPKDDSRVLREIKDAVRRDLENLLNTRARCLSWPPSLEELPASLVNYGLPDFTNTYARAVEDPDSMCKAIQFAIEQFEPRLRDVRVDLLPSNVATERALRFRIDATLYVDPVEDKVFYSSSLEPVSGNFEVS